MADRKSGPVKPPVIDLTARAAAPDTSSTAETPSESAEKQEAPRPLPPRPQARLAMPWSAISIAAIAGAMLGTGAIYGLANLIPLPDQRPQIADPTARLDNQDGSISDLKLRLEELEGQTKRTQVSLDATIVQLDGGFSDLRQSIAGLAQPGSAVDLAPLETRLKDLEDRVAALGAGASTADASTLAATIASLSAGLEAMRSELAAQQARLSSHDEALARAAQDIATARSALSSQGQSLAGSDLGPVVRLPLLVTGVESNFDTGRPFAAELAALVRLLPDIVVPDAIAAAAASGLPRPDTVAGQFAAAVPVMLAARTAAASGDLWETALEWAKGVVAFRPTGELAGDSVEAVISRLEGAVQRRDFVASAGLLDALPAQMRDAAGSVGQDIRTLATAGQFLTDLRSKALAATETAP